MEGQSMDDLRGYEVVQEDVVLTVNGMAAGTYLVTPYDTWQGIYLDAFEVVCEAGQGCEIPLPAFYLDMAFRIERK